MFKKLLTLAAFMAVGVGWGNLAHAQTDVTATYITNPGFEGDYTIETTFQQGTKDERCIYKPDGWTVVHTNPNTNDLTCLTSSDKQSNSFSSYTMKHSGEQTYWARLRWGGQTWKASGTTGKPTSIELQQQLTALPSGVYRLSADLLCYAGGTEANNHVYLKAKSDNNSLQVEPTINHNKSDESWENKSLLITSTGSTEYTVGLQILQNWVGELISGFDDVKLEKLSASAAEPLDITSFVPKGTSNWTNNGANNYGSITSGDVTLVERYYNQHYTGTVSELTVKDLPSGLYEAEVYCHAHCADWNCSAIPEAAGQTDRTILSANNVEYGIPIVNDKSLTEGPQVRLLENISVTDGTLVFKVRNDQEGANWLTFEVKSLKYFGPTIAAEAVEFTSGATMEAGKWYYFDAPFATTYAFAAGTDLNNIVYTTDGSILLENAASVVNSKFAASQDVEVKRYYFKSSEAQTFTFGPASYSYTVGDATSNIADGAYIQSLTTWTLEYASATSDDPDATFALVDGSAKAVLAKGGTPVAEGTLSLDGNTLTATFDGVTLDKESAYTLSLPAGVVGYEGQEANAAVSVAVNTPAVFDGTYYLYNDLTKRFIGRGMNWGTRTVVDKYGIAVNLATGTDGFTTIQFVDNNAYMKNTWWLYADGALADANTFKVIASTVEGAEGYHFATQQVSANLNDKKYLYVYTKDDNDKYACAGNSTMGDNISDWKQTVWQLKTDAERDAIVDAYPTENISNVIDASGVETTAANFETYLSENYTAIDHTDRIGTATFSGSAGDWTWTGTDRTQGGQPAYGNGGFAEVWNATGTYTQTIAASELPAGIYKLTFQGYERRMANDASAALGNAGYNFVSSYVAANDEQVRFTDWYNVPERPTNVDGALTAFAAGYAKNEVFVYLDGETDLTIKVAKPNYIWDCWIIFNNFTLTYYKDKASIVYATDITLDQTSAALTTGETVTLTATVKPENADDQSVTWTSSDATVATVANGVVTALKPGPATITATANGSEEGKPEVLATATITVADAPAPAFYASAIEDGVDYYIVNAATGKFLGGGNNWGTHASLIEHGIPFTVALADGKYTLDSHTFESAEKHFLNSGDYVDGAATEYYISGEGGLFNISSEENAAFVTAKAGSTLVSNNGTDASNSLAQWYFLSKADRDKMLAAATTESPADATYYIKEANFSRYLATTGKGVSAWTGTKTYGGGDGEFGSGNYNARIENAVADVYQTIENIPNGTYTVKMQGCAVGDATFYANGSEFAIITDATDVTDDVTASAAFSAGKYVNTLTITVTGHTLTLGVKSAEPVTKLFFDNFELYMTGYTPVTEVTASIDNSEIEVNGTAQITASVSEGASFDAISYESSDVTVATVDENGLVTAVAEGTATITVKAEMENVSEEINVTVVKPAVIPSEITVMNGEDIITALELDATTNEVTLTAVVGEEGAPQAVVWASDDENVATVSAEGVVTGVAPGTASITVTASGYDDVYATVEVTVTYPESTIPATVEVIDETEMTKTIYTLAQENLIKNGSFEYPNGVGGWKTVGYETDAVASNFTITTEGGVDNGAYLTTNGGAASSEKTIRQSMPVVAGKTYYFAVYTSGKAPSSDNFQYNALFKMTDATTEHGVLKQFEWPQGAGNTSTEWSMTGYVFTADAEHPYVGVRMGWNSNTSFDNFVLVEATVSQVIDLSATAADYAALNAAIADAESKTLGFLQDEYAPYNNVAALQALAAAKAIDQEAKNWPADVQAATGALNTAIWTMNTEEVNAVYNGDFGLSTANTTSGKDVDAPGWVAADGSIRLIIDNATTYPALAETTAGKAAFAWGGTYNYGGKVGYTMPLAAHTVYELTFKHAGWNGANNNFSVSVKNSDNEGLATQSCGKSSAGPQTAGCWSTYVVRFTTGAAGDYTLSMMPNGNSTFTDITLFQVPVSEVTMRIRKANKYGTFVAPFAVTLPEGVTAQKVTNLEANGTTLEMEDVNDVIPAHTPVVIYKGDFEEEDPDFETKFYGQATSTQTEATVGLLTGVYYEQPAPVDSYVLQNIKEKVAFYQVEDGRQPNMRPYSAYLTLPAGYAKPISLSFGDDEATAIAGIEALTSGNMEGIYTTSGAKVNSLQKGVNIIRTKDGKSMKVYVK